MLLKSRLDELNSVGGAGAGCKKPCDWTGTEVATYEKLGFLLRLGGWPSKDLVSI